MYSLSFEKTFAKHYAKLSETERDAVDNKLLILAEDPWYPFLRERIVMAAE